MAPEVKVGDLWKVRRFKDEPFFGIFLIEKKEHEVDNLYVFEYDFQTRKFEKTFSWVDSFDEKITDPEEQAYWLLRFENCR